MDNMRIYNQCREVPPEAQKAITGGRLKGMTDINPMWRIKKLTEMFGPCGIGWYYTQPEYQFVPGNDGEVACIAQTSLVYRDDNGWSQPIPGSGGAMYVAKETKGLYTDDEAPKKALTDALSVACKALGIGADVYFAKDRTKYDKRQQDPSPKQETSHTPESKPEPKQEYPKRLATVQQIEFIEAYADDATYNAAREAFGEGFVKMSYIQADKLIARIKTNGGYENAATV